MSHTIACVTSVGIVSVGLVTAGQHSVPLEEPQGIKKTESSERSPSTTASDGGQVAQAAQLSSGGLNFSCNLVVGPGSPWFTVAHPLFTCGNDLTNWLDVMGGNMQSGRSPSLDIDGNGEPEVLVALAESAEKPYTKRVAGSIPSGTASGYGGHWGNIPGDPAAGVLFVPRLTTYPINPNYREWGLRPVMSAAILYSLSCEALSCPEGTISVIPLLFHFRSLEDLDGDGDLDLIMQVEYRYFQDNGGTGTQTRSIWIENTVTVPPGLAADINGDGAVDGEDLAMVLAGWTP